MPQDVRDAVRATSGEHPPLPTFHNAPGPLFRRGRQIHDALWLRYIGPRLRPLQYAVLTALELEPGIDQQTLGERIALDKSTIGDMIGRLTKRSLINAGDDPTDARRKVLHITEEGQELLYEIAPLAERIGHEMFEPLAPAERDQLLELLNKVVYSFEAASREPDRDGK